MNCRDRAALIALIEDKIREATERWLDANPDVREHLEVVAQLDRWVAEHKVELLMEALSAVPSDPVPEPHGGRTVEWDSKA